MEGLELTAAELTAAAVVGGGGVFGVLRGHDKWRTIQKREFEFPIHSGVFQA